MLKHRGTAQRKRRHDAVMTCMRSPPSVSLRQQSPRNLGNLSCRCSPEINSGDYGGHCIFSRFFAESVASEIEVSGPNSELALPPLEARNRVFRRMAWAAHTEVGGARQEMRRQRSAAGGRAGARLLKKVCRLFKSFKFTPSADHDYTGFPIGFGARPGGGLLCARCASSSLLVILQ